MDGIIRPGVLESGFGVGIGCGVGVGVGSPVNLGQIPVVGQMASGLMAGIDGVLACMGGSTGGLRSGLTKAVPLKGIEGGLGCGVGIGYGFGVGLFVDADKASAVIKHSLPADWLSKLPSPRPLQSTVEPAQDEPPSTSTSKPTDALALSKKGVSSAINEQVGVKTKSEGAKDAALKAAAGDESLENMLTRIALRHEEQIRVLAEENLILMRQVDTLASALCDVTKGRKDQPAFCKQDRSTRGTGSARGGGLP